LVVIWYDGYLIITTSLTGKDGDHVMPYLAIQTNQKLGADQTATLLQKSSKTVSDILGKPESYVMVSIQDAVPMLFAGKPDPAAYLQLKSLGLPESSTADFSRALCDVVNQELAVAPERIYIEFSEPERHMWGWNNETF
jgi:phenylpyruvate tautomerase PptA (4-oxalocrotonate tautomerase family)